MTRILLVLLVFFTPKVLSEDLVAILDLKYLKDTGRTAAELCFGENGSGCEAWATFYLFEAKVKKVISGNISQKKFKVTFGRHALKKKNVKGVVALLVGLPSTHEAQYQILETGERQRAYCFSKESNKLYHARKEEESLDLKCYE